MRNMRNVWKHLQHLKSDAWNANWEAAARHRGARPGQQNKRHKVCISGRSWNYDSGASGRSHDIIQPILERTTLDSSWRWNRIESQLKCAKLPETIKEIGEIKRDFFQCVSSSWQESLTNAQIDVILIGHTFDWQPDRRLQHLVYD